MNIGIAGAGLMGRLMAWQLLRGGHQITLFDSDSVDGFNNAARVAAAMIAPFSEVVSSERIVFDWGMQGLTKWVELIEQLKHDSGSDTEFQRRGSLVVAHPQDHSDLLHFNQIVKSRAQDFSVSIETLDQQTLQEMEPELASTFTQATWLRDEACIDNCALLTNLAVAINTLGATWHSGVDVKSVSAYSINANNQQHNFDWVIDARGFGARDQLTDFRGVRGEVLWVFAPEVKLSRPVRLMHPRYSLYIVPKPQDIYVIGATEIESDSTAPITVRSSLELLSALYSVHAGFSEANILHAFAQCRPAYMNNLPRIDIEDGLMRINGLYRHGYLLAPVVIDAALNAFTGKDNSALVFRRE